MKAGTLRRLAVAVALAVVGSGPLAARLNAITPKEQANLDLVLGWLRDIFQGRHLELAPKYQAESYIQHNINVQTGRDAFVKLFSGFGPPVNPIPATLARPPAIRFAKGDYVALIWDHEAEDPTDASKRYKYNSYDLLRLDNGKIQEHWDYSLKTKGTPLGGAPDGVDYDAVTFDLSPQERRNLEIATVWRKNKPTLTIVSGSYVFMMSKRAEKDPDDPARPYPAYWFDLVRVDDGMVQEHWDAAKKNPPAGRGN
jgi:predicted SnoaL-like aldol condensation-catalyzing enzyme